jgi:hypothetical protein
LPSNVSASVNQYRRAPQQRHLADELTLAAQKYRDTAWRWNA